MILSERLREITSPVPTISISSIRDQFASPDEPCDLLERLGLDAAGIENAVLKILQK